MRVLETMFLELRRSIKLLGCDEDYVQHITLSDL